jgi:hypothetical protein
MDHPGIRLHLWATIASRESLGQRDVWQITIALDSAP